MNVPRLRFKEFRDNWLSTELDKIATTSSGGTPNRAKPEYWGGSIPWVTTSLIDFNVINNSDEFITKEGLKNSSAKLFPKDTLLMAMYGQGKTRGKVAILGLEASTNQACAAITFHLNTINIHFAFQNLAGRYDEIRDLSNAGGQENLSAGLIKQIKITFPSLTEQTKIANFLTAIDEKISQLTQKHDLLTQYKKGVMQQIFSQKLRFKDEDGREFPEWEETILGKVADPAIRWSLTGGPFGSNLKAEDYTGNGIRIIQLQNIGDGTFNDSYKIYTSENKANELLSCNIYPNEIIISKMGDPVARCCIMPSSHDRYLMASDGIRLVVNRSLFNTKYIHDFINYETFRKNALEASTGSTRRRIGLDELKKLLVIYPCLTEQTKIANFLTAIDDKITHTKTQLDAVKQYKKGLLQQLFV